MMDFSKLAVGDKPAERVDVSAMLRFTPKDADGQPFLNGGGKALVIDFHDVAGLDGRREMLKASIKYPPLNVGEGSSEDDLAAAAENAMGRQRESWIRAIKGWNLQNGEGGEAVPFTVENALQFFDLYLSVAASVAEHAVAIVDAVGNARKGSSNGPRKKAG